MTGPILNHSLCFVVMPFRPDMADVYQAIKEAVTHDHQLQCLRGDDIAAPGVIIDDVWSKIRQAQIVIADASGANANVFYEIGLAHASGKEVVLMSQSIDDIPFDLRSRRVIVYEHTATGLQSMTARLSLAIEELKLRRPQIKAWIDTSDPHIKLGLASPTDKEIVHQAVIPASGQVVGLVQMGNHHIIGYVVTDKEYGQGQSDLDREGYWSIDQLHLAATSHGVLFRIFHESGILVAESQVITVIRRRS